ncbi:MAG: HAMP domain-containing sensor histidine kinase [Holophaga sp.]|nr:HAMP domain-containing sensor histidine kinase [Holophaga sp.]
MDPQQVSPLPGLAGGELSRPDRGWRALALVALIAVGMAGNYFKFSVFFNIDFIFGSIAAMLALQWFGLGWGVAAAGLISLPLWLIWGHPYAIPVMTAEVAAVGWLRGRRGIGFIQADALYWVLAGMPLVYILYRGVMGVPLDSTLFIMTKETVNGLANVLVARLAFTLVPRNARQAPIWFREAIYNLLALFVLGPTVILLAVNSRSDFHSADRRVRDALLRESRQQTLAVRKGAANLEAIRGELAQNLGGGGTRFTLLDRNQRVLLSNRDDQAELAPFQRGSGTLEPLEPGISRWLPVVPRRSPFINRWGESSYVAETAIGEPAGWSLVLEQPVAPFQKALFVNYSRDLAVLFALLMASLAVAEVVSRRFARSFVQLGELTSNLPLKLAASGPPLLWPETGIQESNQLIANFRIMAESLSRQFAVVRQANTSLEQRVQERTQELQQKHAEMERFTYMVSHDLKSPLVTIRTFLDYLEQDLRQDKAERAAKDMTFIRDAAGKMAHLLEDLLVVSRVGRVVNPSTRVTLASLVQEALKSVGGAIASRAVEITLEGPPVELFGDHPRLEELWQNLIENAVKYMGDQPAPRIALGAQVTPLETRFYVRDNGMGIDPRFHGKVFGLFEQLDPATEGTGLGLALVKRIVEHYEGRVWLESQGSGQGTCFWFTLPGALHALNQGVS